MKRLKTKGIVSLQPKRIMISGKVRVYAFDKTGTLTKDGLDFLGFRPVVPPGPAGGPARLGKLALPDTGLDQAHLLGLATCHSAEICGAMVIANEVEVREGEGWREGGAAGKEKGGRGRVCARSALSTAAPVKWGSPRPGIRKWARTPVHAPPRWS